MMPQTNVCQICFSTGLQTKPASLLEQQPVLETVAKHGCVAEIGVTYDIVSLLYWHMRCMGAIHSQVVPQTDIACLGLLTAKQHS